MCLFKVKTPKVSQVTTTAKDLVSETVAEEPEAPQYGGNEDTYTKAKGKSALRINKTKNYNPLGL